MCYNYEMSQEILPIGLLHEFNNQPHVRTLLAAHMVEAASKKEVAEQRIAILEKLAGHDGLTGLPNRRSFDEELAREFALERRHEGARPGALILGDIDHFKKINDSLGHQGGDKVLQQVALNLEEGTRSEDFVARYGGEEFAIIAPQTDIEGAVKLANDVRQQINRATGYTMSFGVASIEHGESEAYVIALADRALYNAKRNGRDCVEVAAPPNMAVAK